MPSGGKESMDLGFRVQSLGGLGFRVQGLGCLYLRLSLPLCACHRGSSNFNLVLPQSERG